MPASGLITDDGRFVAETAGFYAITASSGAYSDQKTVKVVPRAVEKDVKLIGHGLRSNRDQWIIATKFGQKLDENGNNIHDFRMHGFVNRFNNNYSCGTFRDRL